MLEAKRYTIKSVNSKDEDFMSHFAHQEILNRKCVIASLEEGEVAWMFVHFPEDKGTIGEWHRLHTSTVNSIKVEGNNITVQTRNTEYILSNV